MLFDRIQVNTSTTGTGTITLGSAVTGYRDFSSVPNSTEVSYTIEGPGRVIWEVGKGVYDSGTLTRVVEISSNSNNPIDLQGNEIVFVTALAQDIVTPDDLADVATSGDYTDLSNTPTLGNSAALDVGTTAGTVAAGDHTHTHFTQTDNPHAVTKAQVGLGDVDNVSATSLRDRTTHTGNQAISTITNLQTALDGKVPSTRALTAGTGIKTLGDLAADRTVEIDKASPANLRAAAADKVLTADLIKDGSALVTLTDAATVAINWEAFVIGDLTISDDRAIGAPTNVQPGVTRAFFVFGDDATEYSLTWHANYVGDIPDMTYTDDRGALIALTPRTSGLIAVTHVVLE